MTQLLGDQNVNDFATLQCNASKYCAAGRKVEAARVEMAVVEDLFSKSTRKAAAGLGMSMHSTWPLPLRDAKWDSKYNDKTSRLNSFVLPCVSSCSDEPACLVFCAHMRKNHVYLGKRRVTKFSSTRWRGMSRNTLAKMATNPLEINIFQKPDI